MSSDKWCHTADGKEINLFDPDPALFTVEQIANALARINRFAGNWERPVSVARHSIFVAELLQVAGHDVETQLQGMFHDAAEAFTTDIPSPLKRLLHIVPPNDGLPPDGNFFRSYSAFEDSFLSFIFDALEIEWPLREKVHEIDKWVTEQEKVWVAGKSDLYRRRTTDPEVVAITFMQHAGELFKDCSREHANDTHRAP